MPYFIDRVFFLLESLAVANLSYSIHIYIKMSLKVENHFIEAAMPLVVCLRISRIQRIAQDRR